MTDDARNIGLPLVEQSTEPLSNQLDCAQSALAAPSPGLAGLLIWERGPFGVLGAPSIGWTYLGCREKSFFATT